jgi:hypothetical protein
MQPFLLVAARGLALLFAGVGNETFTTMETAASDHSPAVSPPS